MFSKKKLFIPRYATPEMPVESAREVPEYSCIL